MRPSASEVLPPATPAGQTFIGPAPAPSPARRTATGTAAVEPAAPAVEPPPAAAEPAAPVEPAAAESPMDYEHPAAAEVRIDFEHPVDPEVRVEFVKPIDDDLPIDTDLPVDDSGPVDAELLATGTRVGDYSISKQIRADGLGRVYTARDTVFERQVIIKVVASHLCRDAARVRQLASEARAASRLDDRHIAELIEVGRLGDGRGYQVMEPLRGDTLTQLLAGGPLALDDAMEILEQVAAALAAAHQAGLAHRALTSDSVFVCPVENGFEVKLLDVGIAGLASPDLGDRDPAADVLAMGRLAHRMITGHPPVDDVPVSASRKEVPAALDSLVSSMLAQSPRKRPSAAEVRTAARRLAHAFYRGFGADLPFRMQARLWLQKPRNRVLLAAQVLLGTAMLVGALVVSSGDDDERPAAASAQPATEPAAKATPTAEPVVKPAEEPVVKPAEEPVVEPAPAPPSVKPLPVPRARKSTRSQPAAPTARPPLPAAKPAPRPPTPAPAPKRDRDAPIRDPFQEM